MDQKKSQDTNAHEIANEALADKLASLRTYPARESEEEVNQEPSFPRGMGLSYWEQPDTIAFQAWAKSLRPGERFHIQDGDVFVAKQAETVPLPPIPKREWQEIRLKREEEERALRRAKFASDAWGVQPSWEAVPAELVNAYRARMREELAHKQAELASIRKTQEQAKEERANLEALKRSLYPLSDGEPVVLGHASFRAYTPEEQQFAEKWQEAGKAPKWVATNLTTPDFRAEARSKLREWALDTAAKHVAEAKGSGCQCADCEREQLWVTRKEVERLQAKTDEQVAREQLRQMEPKASKFVELLKKVFGMGHP